MKKNKKIIGSIGILIICIILFSVGYFINLKKDNTYEDIFKDYDLNKTEIVYNADKDNRMNEKVKNNMKELDNKNNIDVNKNKMEEESGENIKVDIKGAIKNPKVYALKKGSRVEDLIKKAGGLTKNADTIRVNLSKKLIDEEVVYIYSKGEKSKEDFFNFSQGVTDSSLENNNSKKDNKKININKANKEELKTLSGIGDSKADAIIKYREENGGFKSINDLENVSGIGEKTISKFIDKVDIN